MIKKIKEIIQSFKKREPISIGYVLKDIWANPEKFEIPEYSYISYFDQYNIEYYLNDAGYRLPSEKKVDELNKKVIACFGCSNTKGDFIPYKDTWVSLLNEKLGNEWVCRNFGVSGGSMDSIARDIYLYTLRENKPEAICCFFPDIYRMEIYDIELGRFENLNPDVEWGKVINLNALEQISKLYGAYTEIISTQHGFYLFIKNLKFIESLCKLHNIKFYWFTWSIEVRHLINEIEKHISLNGFLYEMLKHDPNDSSIFPKAPDDCHFSRKYNDVLSDHFYKKIIE